ncbi:hypothetical protein AAVH_27492 [Aphelenchoides avenae]|nr:hypothetical protein AAVH_27492 [Aphelenchus avenae]
MMLPWDQYTFYCIDLCVSSVNVIVLILVIILFYGSTYYHRNLKILILNLSVSFMCIALSNFFTALSTLFREPSAAADYAELEEALAAMSNYGMNLAPLTFLAIIFERTMATKYSRVYEHVEHVCYTGTLVVACHIGVFAMGYFFNYCKSA